jgi:hypothetical protein
MKIIFKNKEDVVAFRRSKRAAKWRKCNLCADEFHPRTVFDRYCHTCKEENELFKFSEWLPELDSAITERVSA